WLLGELRSLWEQDGLVPLFLASSLVQGGMIARTAQFTLDEHSFMSCLRELDDVRNESIAAHPSLPFLRSSFLKFLILLSRAYVKQAQREVGFQFRPEI